MLSSSTPTSLTYISLPCNLLESMSFFTLMSGCQQKTLLRPFSTSYKWIHMTTPTLLSNSHCQMAPWKVSCDILLDDGTLYNTCNQQLYSKPIGQFTVKDVNGLSCLGRRCYDSQMQQDSGYRIAVLAHNWKKAWILENSPNMDISILLPRKGGQVIDKQVYLYHPYPSTESLPSSALSLQPHMSLSATPPTVLSISSTKHLPAVKPDWWDTEQQNLPNLARHIFHTSSGRWSLTRG